jgi:hypothetical protein
MSNSLTPFSQPLFNDAKWFMSQEASNFFLFFPFFLHLFLFYLLSLLFFHLFSSLFLTIFLSFFLSFFFSLLYLSFFFIISFFLSTVQKVSDMSVCHDMKQTNKMTFQRCDKQRKLRG